MGLKPGPARTEERRIDEDKDRAETRRMWKKAARFGAVGLEMGLAVAIGYLGGNWLDGRLGTAPVLGLVGLVAGVGAAGKALWDVAREMRRGDEET